MTKDSTSGKAIVTLASLYDQRLVDVVPRDCSPLPTFAGELQGGGQEEVCPPPVRWGP